MQAKLRALAGNRASFSLGHEEPCHATTYDREYSDNSYTKFEYTNNTFARYPKAMRIVRNPLLPDRTVSPQFVENILRDRTNKQKKVLSVHLGYDPKEYSTAYKDFAADYGYQKPRPPMFHKRSENVSEDVKYCMLHNVC